MATFLSRALEEAPSEEEARAASLILSNPFDLTFAADLLAQGQMPSATTLINEAFRLADEGAPGLYSALFGRPSRSHKKTAKPAPAPPAADAA